MLWWDALLDTHFAVHYPTKEEAISYIRNIDTSYKDTVVWP